MCGIAGFLLPRPYWSADEQVRVARAMENRLIHRGPDGGGIWTDARAGLALAHRRLSIIDLSAAGNQPMTSACGRYVMSYNGEIYNTAKLRPRLEAKGTRFRGHSDTEVLLEACARWGVVRAVEQMVGMFAFALWDRKHRTLTLVRDRMGIKPLYWACTNNSILFASELKALHCFPEFSPSISEAGLAGYLRHGYVPAPHTIFRNTNKLLPGTLLTVQPGEAPHIRPYWSLKNRVNEARADDTIDDVDAAARTIEPLLKDAVKGRMLSDVELGAFLSGGIDSSLVVALMQEQSNQPVRTYSIGFADTSYNEAEHAKNIARHLGTEHTEHYVKEGDLLDIIPGLPEHYDEPFADSSQIPTLILSALTRRDVTVSLSGDGGDELFAGYNRYVWNARIASARRFLPRAIRQGAAKMLSAPAAMWDAMLQPIAKRGPGISAGRRVHKLASMLSADDGDVAYRALTSFWSTIYPSDWEIMPSAYADVAATPLTADEERMQFFDMLTYLPDDILTKVDRASMAYSLEVRVPLLDHRVVEASWRIGLSAKLDQRKGNKLVLRKLLYDRVPKQLFQRPKMGFAVPLERWLREDLSNWAHELIGTTDWSNDFGIDGFAIRRAWSEHCKSRINWADHLWVILMLAAWQREWRNESRPIGQDVCSQSLVGT